MEKNIIQQFPRNLLNYLEHSNEHNRISGDRRNGIEYAVSTLPENGRKWISLRFREGFSSEETARSLGLTLEQERKLRQDTLRKLRSTKRREWIAYGIEGNVRQIKELTRAEAYEEGYRKGLEDGKTGKFPQTPDAATLSQPVAVLPIPNRILCRLTVEGYTTVGSLLDMDEFQIMRTRGLGACSAGKVALALRQLGLYGSAWDKYIRACR